ncbi:MAG: PepSY domain-containing protein [Crocosphaera sp.]|nr:PepSY domain-containing protein [Crocosphaera sp.]
MNLLNKVALRQLHYKIAPFMIFPLLLTVITGTLFQVAVVTGNANDFIWLLELHRGKFGRINLEMIYPFLNGFGLLMLGITGVVMWLQTRPRN